MRSQPSLAPNRPSVRGGIAAAWALWVARWAFVACALASAAAVEVPSRLGDLGRSLVDDPSDENYRKLRTYAESASGLAQAAAEYALGMARYADEEYAEAESHLALVGPEAGFLAEYAAYYRARCVVLAEEFERALPLLGEFAKRYPQSRFQPAAGRLRAESLLRLGRLDAARELLAREDGPVEDPVRFYLAGRVEHVDGNLQAAARLYRKAYYFHPFSDQAAAAESQLGKLRGTLGEKYPDAPAEWRLARAGKLYDRREFSRASSEFGRALGAGLAGGDRDLAIVRKGAADYQSMRTSQAYSALARARPKDPDLDAERLYWLCALERRQRIVGPMLESVAKLAQRHARSDWYEKALLVVGNYYYLAHDRAEYPRWFRRLEQAFPEGQHAPYAHWKVCWRAWLDDVPERRALLDEHLRRFPDGEHAAGALYWLGRLDEREGREAEALRRYRAVVDAFPQYYYAVVAGERLREAGRGDPAPAGGAGDAEVSIPRPRALAAEMDPVTHAAVERGSALAALGFDADAAVEFHRVDYRRPDSHFAGLHLGRLHTRREEHYLALRALKRYAFGYLRFPMDSLDEEYWRYLYPLGWEQRLRARAGRHGLDPYLVAALIRRESEFNAVARSRAGALGLMQIMPATGRGLFRKLGIPGFSSRKLTVPDTSLRLGTFHLKEVLARFDGDLEKALAGYNAGERRIPQWMARGPFDEPAEFVESIPFSETRGYVQAIVRDRATYRRLYGN